MAAHLLLYQDGHKYLCTQVEHVTYDQLMQAPVYLIKPGTLQTFEKQQNVHQCRTSSRHHILYP